MTPTIHNARYVFGVTILATHFLAIAIYLVMTFSNVSQRGELFSVLLGVTSLMPLTAVYATTFYRYVVRNPNVPESDRTKRMGSGPFLVQLGVIGIFCLSLLGLLPVLFWNEDLVSGYQNIPSFVSLLEGIFGVFLGLTFSELFPLQWESPER